MLSPAVGHGTSNILILKNKRNVMTRVFFDVTDLRKYLQHAHRLSGIQRVATMVIQEAAAGLGKEAVYLSFLDKRSGNYLCLSYADLGTDDITQPSSLSAALGVVQAAGGPRPTLQRYANNPLKHKFHSTLRDLNALVGNTRHFEKRGTSITAWKASAPSVRNAGPRPDRRFADFFATARQGDRLVLLDASWGDDRASKAHARAHEKGIKVDALIHDLIPIVTPEHVPAAHSLTFHTWLHGTLDYVDVYLANSNATAVDLRAFLATYGADIPVRIVQLAQAGIPVPAKEAAHVPDALKLVDGGMYPGLHSGFYIDENVRALLKRPYVLCVGTIETRKNCWAMAHAWNRMIRAGVTGLPRLVFAGRPGWLNSDFDRLMNATGYLGGWVEVLHGPSDEDLDFLYRNCLFTIYASFIEGWGLPIGESLSYGKTCVVSNCSSMPEVGGDMVEYCDPRSIESIQEACMKLISSPERRTALEMRIAATRLRTWRDVAEEIIAAVQE